MHRPATRNRDRTSTANPSPKTSVVGPCWWPRSHLSPEHAAQTANLKFAHLHLKTALCEKMPSAPSAEELRCVHDLTDPGGGTALGSGLARGLRVVLKASNKTPMVNHLRRFTEFTMSVSLQNYSIRSIPTLARNDVIHSVPRSTSRGVSTVSNHTLTRLGSVKVPSSQQLTAPSLANDRGGRMQVRALAAPDTIEAVKLVATSYVTSAALFGVVEGLRTAIVLEKDDPKPFVLKWAENARFHALIGGLLAAGPATAAATTLMLLLERQGVPPAQATVAAGAAALATFVGIVKLT